jgi:hypothetical protein
LRQSGSGKQHRAEHGYCGNAKESQGHRSAHGRQRSDSTCWYRRHCKWQESRGAISCSDRGIDADPSPGPGGASGAFAEKTLTSWARRGVLVQLLDSLGKIWNSPDLSDLCRHGCIDQNVTDGLSNNLPTTGRQPAMARNETSYPRALSIGRVGNVNILRT